MKTKGMWVSPTEFVNFAEPRNTLSSQIATRGRSIDFYGLGMYLPNPDPVLKALGKDIKVYRELRADAHVGGCLRRRKAAVKALEWGVDREKSRSRVAKNIEAIFADLPIERIITEMLDAVLYGYQPLEITWQKVGSMIVPVDIVGKPPQWFVFDEDSKLRFRTRDNSVKGEELPERKFLLPRQDPSYDNPYGFPDMSMVFWPTTFKKGGLKFWVQFTEKYGAPWVVGKHPRGTSDADADALLDKLESMVQDAVAVIPDDSSVEIKEAAGKAGSADVYERMLHFCRSEVSIALLGQNQTTEAKTNFASAKAGIEVTREIRDGDKSIVEEAFNTLVRWVCDLNFSDGARPVFSMWEQEEVDKILAERDEKLVRAGARLTPAYFKRAYALQDGDLDETPLPPTGNPAALRLASTGLDGADPAAAFAEGDGLVPDQEALDAALDALSPDDLNADMQALLAPLFEQIKRGTDPESLLGSLAELYPDMDGADLQERLARAIFVANMWGRLHA